jgi:predicted kinase
VSVAARRLRPAGVTWLGEGDGVADLRVGAGDLVIVGGPPGAGKSTLARATLDDSAGVALVDPDDVRAELGAARGAPAAAVPWPEALAEAERRLATALAGGGGAVCVTTALRHGHRVGLARHATRAGRAAHLVLLDTPEHVCRAAHGGSARAPGSPTGSSSTCSPSGARCGRRCAMPPPCARRRST